MQNFALINPVSILLSIIFVLFPYISSPFLSHGNPAINPPSFQGPTYQAGINMEFLPVQIPAGGVSTLSISIYNSNTFPLVLSSSPAAWTDTLPAGMTFAEPLNASTTCGGTITTAGGMLALVGGSVPAQVLTTPGSCTVRVDVTSITPGNLINTIAAGNLIATNPAGDLHVSNPTAASATLQVNVVQPPSLSKAFAPNTVWVGQNSRLTITIRNNDGNVALSNVSLTDTLPENVSLAAVPNIATTCGGTITSTQGSVTLTEGTVPRNASCTVQFNVSSTVPGVYNNLIPAGTLRSSQGVTNASAASAPLNVQAIGVAKVFSPNSIQAGGVSRLRITLQNPSPTPYTAAAFTDLLPTGLRVANVPDATITNCGPDVVFSPASGDTQLTFSGGTIPAGTTGTPGTCVVSVQVTSDTTATYTNRIPVGGLTAMTGTSPVSNVLAASANLTVYGIGLGLSGSKSFNPSIISLGNVSRMSITLSAPADISLTGVGLTDALPEGMFVADTPNPGLVNCGTSAIFSPAAGSTLLTFSGGTIVPPNACTISVNVTTNATGIFTNRIAAANIRNDQNRNISGSFQNNLMVSGLTVSKSFSPNSVNPGGISTLTIVVTNTNSLQLDSVAFTDTLPGNTSNGVVIADPARASTTCGEDYTLTADPGTQTIRLTGGTVPAQVGSVPGICTVVVDVAGRGTGSFTNTLGVGSVTGTLHGTGAVVSNRAQATAVLSVQPISINVVKSFTPITVSGGSASILSIVLTNPTTVPLTGISFTDLLPQSVDGGMFIANPPQISTGTCGGSLTALPGATSFTFSGGYLAGSATCTLTVRVTMNVVDNLTNTLTAGSVTTSNGASNSQPASATLHNAGGASVSKYFGPNPIFAGDGNISILTIVIQNLSSFPLTGVGLVDTLPEGMSFAVPPEPNQCGLSGLITIDGNRMTLSSGRVEAFSSCQIVLQVTAPTAGTYTNCITEDSLTNAEGIPNEDVSCDTLTVNQPPAAPVITKAFSPNPVAAGGTAALTFTLRNPVENSVPLTGVSFIDNFPPGLERASQPNVSQCGGIVSSTLNSIQLTGGTIPVNSTCTVTVSVTAAAGGDYQNVTEPITSTNGGQGGTASATLAVLSPPVMAKEFGAESIIAGGRTRLIFTITNPNGANEITGVRFTDVLPSGMAVATDPNPLFNGCSSSSTPVFTPVAGETNLLFQGGSIAAGAVCTIELDVTASGGVYTNTTSEVTTTNAGTGSPASDTLTAVGGGLRLEKSTTSHSFRAAGETILYDYTVTNTGSITLYGPFDITDDRIGLISDCGGVVSLDPGGSTTCTASYTVIAQDVTARVLTNTATVSGEDESANPITSNQASVTLRLAALTIDKSTTTGGYRAAGNTITYLYTLTNTGDVALYGSGPDGEFLVEDDRIGTPPGTPFACASSPTSLAPGANLPCTNRTYTVVSDDLTAGQVTNNAVALGLDQPGSGDLVTSNTDQVTVYLVRPPVISKTFDPPTITAGGVSNLVITIENPGTNTVPLSGVSFTDTFPAGMVISTAPDTAQCGGSVTSTAGSLSLTNGAILPNSSCIVTARVSASNRGSYLNTTGAVNSTQGGTGTVSNTAALLVLAPPQISKSFSPGTILVNGISRLTFTLTNPNTIAGSDLVGVSFADPFPTGLQVADPPNAVTNCAGAVFAPVTSDTSLSFSGATISPGESCTAAVDLIAVTPGIKDNTTSVITSTNGGTGATSNTARLIVENPALSLVKEISSGDPFTAVNGTINYTYTISNIGNVTLIGNGIDGRFTISDDLIGTPRGTPFLCPPTPTGLVPGESVVCSASYTLTQADLDAGSVTNTAVGYGLYGSVSIETPSSTAIAFAVQEPGLNLEKTITEGENYSSSGDTITYHYVLTNSGNVTITGSGSGGAFLISDDRIGSPLGAPFACGAVTSLASGESVECDIDYTVTLTDMDAGEVTNTATSYALWGAVPLTAVDTQTANASQMPGLSLEKILISGDNYDAPGQQLVYQYTLTNSGNVTLTGNAAGGLFSISDDHIGEPFGSLFSCGAATSLAPGEFVTCSASYVVSQADLDLGSIINTARGYGLFGEEPVTSPDDTAEAGALQAPEMALEKIVLAGEPFTAAGETLTYGYTLRNTGNVTLTGAGAGGLFTITDDHIGNPAGTPFSCGTVDSLAPLEEVMCSATYEVSQADMDSGVVTNEAYGHALFVEIEVNTPEVSATALGTRSPSLAFAKVIQSGAVFDSIGDEVVYQYTLTNTGNVTLTGAGEGGIFTVTDDRIGDPPNTAFACGSTVSLPPGASLTCEVPYVISQTDLDVGEVTNTASGHAVFDGRLVDSDPASQTAEARQGAQLTLVKSITEGASFSAVGDTVLYQYTLTNSGNVTLSGVGGGYFTIIDDHIGDPPGTAFSCGDTQVLAPGATVVCTASYKITQADMDAGSVTNTATGHGSFGLSPVDSEPAQQTATTEAQAEQLLLEKTIISGDPFTRAGDVVEYSYRLTNHGNVTLTGNGDGGVFTITDDHIGQPPGSPFACGTVTSLAPGESLTCTARYSITAGDFSAFLVTNRAVGHGIFDETEVDSNEDSATANVKRGIITGVVYFDEDLDRKQGGNEAVIPGVLITLYDTELNVIASVRTDASGVYLLSDLLPGEYLVIEGDPLGFTSTTPNAVEVDLDAGETERADFGDTKIAGSSTNSIGGTVFVDANNNGIRDTGEAPIPGVTVQLFDQNGKIVGSRITGVDGSYLFENLAPGIYSVVETNPQNYLSTTLDKVVVVLATPTHAVVDFGDRAISPGLIVVDPALTKMGSPDRARIGDTLIFSITVGNNGNSNAENVIFSDALPEFLDLINATVHPNNGQRVDIKDQLVSVELGTIRPGDYYTITIVTRVLKSARPPGGVNTAQVTTTSVGDPIFNNQSSARVVIYTLPEDQMLPRTGFAPDQVTSLPVQPAGAYVEEPGMMIEIPALGLKTQVVGIPAADDGWDVSWLGDRLGYLEGTAFPTWAGNSVITGHVFDADGKPGPLVNLSGLKWGDRIIIHAFGQRYIYEVRQVFITGSYDRKVFAHQDMPWLTLLTCKQYNEKEGNYESRVVVQAVQVKVE